MINIRSYISKDLVFGAFGGSILATILWNYIYKKAIDDSNKALELSNEELKKAAENLEKYDNLCEEQNKVIEDQNKVQKDANKKIKELEDELAKYKTKEVLEEREMIKKEMAKEAIKNKEWDTVYNLTERWYNHYPVDMSRSEVFTNLEKDGYITQEEHTEAYNYFGSLWFYVGD